MFENIGMWVSNRLGYLLPLAEGCAELKVRLLVGLF